MAAREQSPAWVPHARRHPHRGVATGLDLLLSELVRHHAASDAAGRPAARSAARSAGTPGGAARRSPTVDPDVVEQAPLAAPAAARPARPARTARIPRQSRPVPPPVTPPEEETPEDSHQETRRLVERAQGGEAEAFGQLYDRNVDTVYRYVYYRVGSVALAEDLVSETFLRALRRIDTFTYQGRDVAAWFITIARNLIADHYKSGRFRLELSTEDMVGTSGERAAADNPESQVLEAMTNRVLITAIKELNSEQQECVVLRFLQGLSVSETAEAMGKNEGAIKALQYRAVKTLARKLPPGSSF